MSNKQLTRFRQVERYEYSFYYTEDAKKLRRQQDLSDILHCYGVTRPEIFSDIILHYIIQSVENHANSKPMELKALVISLLCVATDNPELDAALRGENPTTSPNDEYDMIEEAILAQFHAFPKKLNDLILYLNDSKKDCPIYEEVTPCILMLVCLLHPDFGKKLNIDSLVTQLSGFAHKNNPTAQLMLGLYYEKLLRPMISDERTHILVDSRPSPRPIRFDAVDEIKRMIKRRREDIEMIVDALKNCLTYYQLAADEHNVCLAQIRLAKLYQDVHLRYHHEPELGDKYPDFLQLIAFHGFPSLGYHQWLKEHSSLLVPNLEKSLFYAEKALQHDDLNGNVLYDAEDKSNIELLIARCANHAPQSSVNDTSIRTMHDDALDEYQDTLSLDCLYKSNSAHMFNRKNYMPRRTMRYYWRHGLFSSSQISSEEQERLDNSSRCVLS